MNSTLVPPVSYNHNQTTPIYLLQAAKFTRFLTLVVAFVSRWIGRLFMLLIHLIFYLSNGLSQFCLTVITLAFLVIVLAFIKSVRPRYKLISSETREKHIQVPSRAQRIPETHSKTDVTRTVTPRELSIIDEARQYKETCSYSVTNADIQTIYRRLSWSETQLELESVNWINQTALTFWPSIKTMINNFLVDYAKNKRKSDDKAKLASTETKSKIDRPKLSIYLSCRRKLGLLRKARASQLKDNSPVTNSIQFVVYLFRIFVVYAKQFFIDQLLCLTSSFSATGAVAQSGNGNLRTDQPRQKVDLKDILQKNKIQVTLGKQYHQSNGVAIKNTSNDPTTTINTTTTTSATVKETSQTAKKQHHKIRGPLHQAGIASNTRMLSSTRGLVSPSTRAKLRDRRLRLLHNIDRARVMSPSVQGGHGSTTMIDNLNLGNSLPIVSGVKYIEADNNVLLAEVRHDNLHITPSDRSNMRLLVELSYQSDKNFNIQLSSLPVLNRLRLTKLSFQFRFIITINHSNVGTDDKNLDIFAAPDTVLFPFINQAKFALVDAFHIDWHVKKATETKLIKMKPLDNVQQEKNKKKQKDNDNTKLTQKINRKLVQLITKFLNPIKIINHNYFKYIVHMALFVGQRWMKPFDISVGDRFLIRTLY